MRGRWGGCSHGCGGCSRGCGGCGGCSHGRGGCSHGCGGCGHGHGRGHHLVVVVVVVVVMVIIVIPCIGLPHTSSPHHCRCPPSHLLILGVLSLMKAARQHLLCAVSRSEVLGWFYNPNTTPKRQRESSGLPVWNWTGVALKGVLHQAD